MRISRYAKAIVAVGSAALLAVQTTITMSDNARGWVTVSIAVLGAAAVYAVPNATPTPAPQAATDVHIGAEDREEA